MPHTRTTAGKRRVILREPAAEATAPPTAGAPVSLVDQLADLLERQPDRPSWDEYFMATALAPKSGTPCINCVTPGPLPIDW